MKNDYIAIFDSGIGGFTTLLDAVKLFPNENFLYYADTANVPYGEKNATEVRQITEYSISKILDFNVKAIVIACNTATSAAIADLRRKYDLPILGMEPAVKPALNITNNHSTANRVMLLSTKLTQQNHKLVQLLRQLDEKHRVDCIPLPGLVTFAESLDFKSSDVISYLQQNILCHDLSQYGTIVLGCTHFIWYRQLLTELLPPHIKLIDGNDGTLRNLHRILDQQELLSAKRDQRERVHLCFSKSVGDSKLDFLKKQLGDSILV